MARGSVSHRERNGRSSHSDGGGDVATRPAIAAIAAPLDPLDPLHRRAVEQHAAVDLVVRQRRVRQRRVVEPPRPGRMAIARGRPPPARG